MPFPWQPEVGNLWGMCGEPRKRFPTLQSLYTSAFQAICGEWGENANKDVTDLSLLSLVDVVQSVSLRTPLFHLILILWVIPIPNLTLTPSLFLLIQTLYYLLFPLQQILILYHFHNQNPLCHPYQVAIISLLS